ncbi:replication-relaxation family protein [Psychrobacillus sp. PGGUH221]|uniref:replication-relaxation family protein n=1 Tax=Psychrobacillus sp. PGGUH221 TaxID=3020058 RepID=UPI0035C75404
MQKEREIIKKTETLYQVGKENSIVLKDSEISLLEQLMIHRIMHSKSIHLFLSQLAGKKLNSNAISNRLRRLVEAKILERVTLNISVTRAHVPRYYYKLGLRAYRCLVSLKRIENTKENFNIFKVSRKSEVPRLHTDAMSILANQIYLHSISKSYVNFTHMRGVEGVIVTSEGQELGIRGLNYAIPDWIFLQEKHFIFVELDTGSQEQKMIREKIDNYESLNKIFLEKNGYTMSLVFAVLDNSIDVVQKNKKQNRSKRVASLKQNLSSICFSIFAVSAKRASYLILKILTNLKIDKYELTCHWLNMAETVISSKKNLLVEQIHDPEELPQELLEVQNDVLDLPLLKLTLNQRSQYLLPIFVLEGNVESYKSIKFVYQAISDINTKVKTSEIILVLVYVNSMESIEDILGIDISFKVYKTDLITWQQTNNLPRMLKVTGPFTQE